jgi:hypothetical protein
MLVFIILLINAQTPLSNAGIIAEFLTKVFIREGAPACVDMRLPLAEKVAILGPLAEKKVLSDTTGCNTRLLVEPEFTVFALRHKRDFAIRNIRANIGITIIQQGVVQRVFFEKLVYRDTVLLALVPDIAGPGSLGFNYVEDRRPFRKWVEPMLVLISIFSSVYLLYTVRS